MATLKQFMDCIFSGEFYQAEIISKNYMFQITEGEGTAFSVYQNQVDICNFINGKREGENKVYIKDKLCALKNWKNNLLDGVYICYNQNGDISLKGQYKNGKKVGQFERWDSKYHQISNYKNDKLHGYVKRYNIDTGIINRVCGYKNNKADGKFVEYYPDGKIASIVMYKNDKMDGEYISYKTDGTVLSHSFIKKRHHYNVVQAKELFPEGPWIEDEDKIQEL